MHWAFELEEWRTQIVTAKAAIRTALGMRRIFYLPRLEVERFSQSRIVWVAVSNVIREPRP